MRYSAIFIAVGATAFGAIAKAQPAPRACTLMWQAADKQFFRSPMPGFDPAFAGPIQLPEVDGRPSMVICSGGTGLPEPKDYRLLSERSLPIGYGDGPGMYLLVIDKGQLKFLYPKDGAVLPDQNKVALLLGGMQKAMQDEFVARR